MDVVEKAIFSDVRVIRPAKPDFTPYRDYIGSVLEILDVETGRRQVVRRSAEPFEAPELDDRRRALLYNTSGRGDGRGRIHRFDLATRKSSVVDTGFAIRNNNDHVLSFDGKMLGISDQSQDEGRSTVYVLPSAGGVPKKITPLTPSYLHGWSPDGKQLVYTGGRGRRVRHLRARLGRQRRGDEPHELEGARRRPRVHARTAATSTSTRCATGRCRSSA